VKFGKVNIDKARSIAAQYQIAVIPQVYLFHRGEPRPIMVFANDLATSENNIAQEIASVLQEPESAR
jgi:thioredoxin-like negative regulator of GroEL